MSAKRIDIPLDLSIEERAQTWPRLTDDWKSYTVQKGETLSELFSRANVPASELYKILHSKEVKTDLSLLMPGQNIHFMHDQNKNLISVRLDTSPLSLSLFKRNDQGDFIEEKLSREPEKVLRYSEGEIKGAFFTAGENAAMSQQTIMALANIFGWDIDFSLDIRPGDSFKVLYYQEYLDGDGDILAAEFTTQGQTHKAVRYTDQSGKSDYYSPDGRSMRKQFLRSPVDFTRISSHFTKRRFHPVLNRFRSHRGTDYAARTGTPIRATGDGKIIKSRFSRSYGNHVVLKHGSRYTTLYAHMSKYGRGIKEGRSVKQGQIIGYVGSTGLASGPHLHYEFRVNGIHKNPVTIKFPDVEPIAKKERERFDQYASNLLSNLENYPNRQLAQLGNE
ncbi:peptidoglycan DD-metalloendopeptidase family protein [Oceanospirillum sp. HFRX-1_2]